MKWLAWLWILGLAPLWAAGGDVVLSHATVHPVVGPVVTDATVTVHDGHIVSIARTAPPPSAVDLHGGRLYPSLIEPDSTLGLVEILAVPQTRDDTETGDLNANLRADIAFNPDSLLLPVAESAGILVAGVAPRGGVIMGRSAVLQLSGWTREDMTLKSPAGLYVQWPSMDIHREPDAEPPVEEQEKTLRENLRTFKEYFANARAWVQAHGCTEDDVQWSAMAPVIEGQLPVVVRADRLDEIEAALDWAESEKLHMVLLGGADAWRCADRLAKAHVGVIFTEEMRIPDGRDFENFDTYYRAPGVLAKAGVSLALSSGQSPGQIRDLRDIAGRAEAYGLSPDAALRAITLTPAELLGVADRVGSLQVGKDATFFVADGDILDPRTHVLRAWVQGREVDLTQDHQRRLYDKYRQRP